MKVQSALPAMTAAFAMISGACSSSPGIQSGTGGSSSTGGTTGTGGSSSGTGGADGCGSCPNVTACGGNAVGTWNVTLVVPHREWQRRCVVAGLDPSTCTSVAISGSLP